MSKRKKIVAEPISEIRSSDTGEVMGWVYRWNTGDLQEAWRGRQTAGSHELFASDPGVSGIVASTAQPSRRRAAVAAE